MSTADMAGVVVVGLGAILSLIGAMYKLWFQPIQDLTTPIALLNHSLLTIKDNQAITDNTISEHRQGLRDLYDLTKDHDYRLKNIENTVFVKDRTQ